MTSFLLALQFLTVIPVKVKDANQKSIVRSLAFFPLVGLFLGFILCSADKFFLFLNFPQLSIDIILVVLLIVITGGMHLDGLSDTFDAFLSRKNREEMLLIMRDSHVGALGVSAMACGILLKIALLYAVVLSEKWAALLLVCVLSRWALVFLMFMFKYARQEGKAKIFMQEKNKSVFFTATILALLAVIIIGKSRGVVIFALIALFAYLAGKFITRKIGGITGDTLGAMNEFIELAVLFTVAIYGGR